MKALVLTAADRLEIQDLPTPEVGPEEVLVRVAACGISESDVCGLDGSSPQRRPPLVMGHEAAGTIAQVGAAVRGWAVGDRVTFDAVFPCGHCWFCERNLMHLCDDRRGLGVSSAAYRRDGAMAELVAVPQHFLYRLPEEMSFPQAAMVEPLAVAIHAVRRARMRRKRIRPSDVAVVFGAGAIGLLVIQVLRASGCGCVLAVEADAARRELARRLGAAETFDPAAARVRDEVLRRTEGRGADMAIESAGTPASAPAAIGCLRKGGQLTLVGDPAPETAAPLQAVVEKELTLYGAWGSRREYPTCLEMIARKTIRLDELVTAVAPLEAGPEWFARLFRREPGLIKVILAP